MSRASATAVFSALLAAIGLVLLIETAVVGGTLGYLLGAVFLLAGALRLYLALR
ncbi:MAG: hypothetical protein ABR521_11530 [Gaiellaceae bacterium]